MPLRDLKQRWWSPQAWSALLEARRQLRGLTYDRVLDTQGLIKSAFVARWANGPIAGFAKESAREPLAARGYDQHFAVPRVLHAVERNRRLAAGIFGFDLDNPVDYGLRVPAATPSVIAALTPVPYVVFLHATSRANKMWPESNWAALGRRFREKGIGVVLPWGNPEERLASERLASAIPAAVVPPALSLLEAAALISGSSGVIGVDTGLAHLAVALARPSVGLYLTTSPALTGLYGNNLAINLGGGSVQQPVLPRVDEAWEAFLSLQADLIG